MRFPVKKVPVKKTAPYWWSYERFKFTLWNCRISKFPGSLRIILTLSCRHSITMWRDLRPMQSAIIHTTTVTETRLFLQRVGLVSKQNGTYMNRFGSIASDVDKTWSYLTIYFRIGRHHWEDETERFRLVPFVLSFRLLLLILRSSFDTTLDRYVTVWKRKKR